VDHDEQEEKVEADSFWDGFEKHMASLDATLAVLNEEDRIK
jgi:hypothetical protein